MTESEKWTEGKVLDLLRSRHAKTSGNGPEWAYLEHVRDAAGFDAKRTIDALALHLWPSRGHEMHAFEVKVSRSDWRRELADPAKADGWCAIVDRFWIVAPRGVVPPEEIPAAWGLLETRASGLTATVPAPLLRQKAERQKIGRSLLVCMLRAAGAGLQSTPDQAAIAAAEARGREQGAASAQRQIESLTSQRDDWMSRGQTARDALGTFTKALGGIDVGVWAAGNTDRVQQVADALRAVLAGDRAVRDAQQNVERAAQQLEASAKHLREHAGKYA
jgi:hypothetical protein